MATSFTPGTTDAVARVRRQTVGDLLHRTVRRNPDELAGVADELLTPMVPVRTRRGITRYPRHWVAAAAGCCAAGWCAGGTASGGREVAEGKDDRSAQRAAGEEFVNMAGVQRVP